MRDGSCTTTAIVLQNSGFGNSANAILALLNYDRVAPEYLFRRPCARVRAERSSYRVCVDGVAIKQGIECSALRQEADRVTSIR
jgi:hypothetical protein